MKRMTGSIEILKTVAFDDKKWAVYDFDWSNRNDPEHGINKIKCFFLARRESKILL